MSPSPIISRKLFLLLLYNTFAAMAYPVGFSLGQTYLTSAFYTQADELVPVIRVVANEEWQSYFLETWKDPKHRTSLSDEKVRLLFKSTLQQIQTASETALNRKVTTNSIVSPEHFQESPSIQLLVETAVQEGFVTAFHQVTSALNGARLAYGLDSCDGLGLKPDPDCDDFELWGPSNYVLIVDYDQASFSLAVVAVRHYTCCPYDIKHYEQYGENSGSILDKHRFDYFSQDLREYVAAWAEKRRIEGGNPKALEQLRAIVLSGEASTAAMEEMRQALATSLPEFQNTLRTSLDPHFIGAFGAAQRARHIIQDPSFLDPPNPGYNAGLAFADEEL